MSKLDLLKLLSKKIEIRKRFEKEMEYINRFNCTFVNDNLKEAINEVDKVIKENI